MSFQEYFSHLGTCICVWGVSVDQTSWYMHSRDMESECKLLKFWWSAPMCKSCCLFSLYRWDVVIYLLLCFGVSTKQSTLHMGSVASCSWLCWVVWAARQEIILCPSWWFSFLPSLYLDFIAFLLFLQATVLAYIWLYLNIVPLKESKWK